jgi:hypothetical protein
VDKNCNCYSMFGQPHFHDCPAYKPVGSMNEEQKPCPICDSEERRSSGLLTCECPAALTQRAIDINNLRFYSAMAHDFKWQTDIIHWSVISKTLQEIADRLASDETNFYKIDQKLEQILGPIPKPL